MELLLIFGGVFSAFQIGRALQWLSDAKKVLGKGDDRNLRR
jgi:hypothetical protein